jgi:Tol biopolymer transport system component
MQTGAADYRLSRQGTLVYVPGAAAEGGGVARSIAWVTRDGHEEAIAVPPRAYVLPRLSPDETQVAVDVRDQPGRGDIWIWNFARKTLAPMTFDPGADVAPVWSPDGQRIVFASARAPDS